MSYHMCITVWGQQSATEARFAQKPSKSMKRKKLHEYPPNSSSEINSRRRQLEITRALSRWVFLAAAQCASSALYAADYTAAASRAANWLEEQQSQTDGSWPGQSLPEKFIATQESVLALDHMGRRRHHFYAGQSWVKNHAATNVDFLARRIATISESRLNSVEDLALLATAAKSDQASGIGWGLSDRYFPSALDTSLVVDAFRRAGLSFDSAASIEYLKRTQHTTSGAQGWSVTTSNALEPSITARVMRTLAPYVVSDSSLTQILNNAKNSLLNKVTPASPVHVKALASLAYLSIDPVSNDAINLLNSLLVEQLDNGSFENNPVVTALAIQAFAVASGVSPVSESQTVSVVDAGLRKAINDAIGRGAFDQIGRSEMGALTSLLVLDKDVTDFSSLQYATNLMEANLIRSGLTSLSQVSFLSAPYLLFTDYGKLSPLIPAQTDSDGDGVADVNEIQVGTNPFNPSARPFFKNRGAFTISSLENAAANLPDQSAWNSALDDVDGDGDIDVIAYLNGARENVMDIGCSYDCGGWYTGPDFGVLEVAQYINNQYIRTPFTSEQNIIRGDVESIVTLDFNNDGKRDILLVLDDVSTSTTVAQNRTNKPYRRFVLFVNDSAPQFSTPENPYGLHFTDTTSAVGLLGSSWAASGLVLDLNRDGYPDILSRRLDAGVTQLTAHVYNRTNNSYSELSISGIPLESEPLAVADLDNDRLLDVIAYEYGPGLNFFKNNGDLTFSKITNRGDLSQLSGSYIAKIMPAYLDDDNNVDLVIFETALQGFPFPPSYAGAKFRVIKGGGVSGGEISMVEDPLVNVENSGGYTEVAFGGTVADVDNDGHLDVLISASEDGSTVYFANEMGSYSKIDDYEGLGRFNDRQVSKFADPVVTDLDLNGYPDIVWPSWRGYESLESVGKWGGVRNSISIELVGRNRANPPSSGRDAFGARVEVAVGGRVMSQLVTSTMSSSRRMLFGLGPHSSGVQVTVHWPGSAAPLVVSADSHINGLLMIVEP